MKDKKNIVIALLVIVVIALGGYLIYDKVNNKSNCDTNNKQEEKANNTNVDKNSEVTKRTYDSVGLNYVGLAFTGFKELDWPTAKWGKETDEPEKIVRNVNLPKINITTTAADDLNKKILKDYNGIINMLYQNNDDDIDPISLDVNYTYTVLNNVIFISISTENYFFRGTSSSDVDVYYYDIDSDKELTYQEVLNKFGIKESFLLKYVANETNGTDLQKLKAIYPVLANTKLRIYYMSDEEFTGLAVQIIV